MNFCTGSVPCANLTSCMMVECSIVSSCAEKKTWGAGAAAGAAGGIQHRTIRTTHWPCLCAHTMTWSSALPSNARRPASLLCFLRSQMLASSNPAHSMCVRRTQSPGPLLCHPCPLPSFLPPPPPRPSNACLLQPRNTACPGLSFPHSLRHTTHPSPPGRMGFPCGHPTSTPIHCQLHCRTCPLAVFSVCCRQGPRQVTLALAATNTCAPLSGPQGHA